MTGTLGMIALVLAVLGVASRLLARSRPLHHLIPAPYRWIPDAAAATVGALLLSLPGASGQIEIVESVATALLIGAIAVAPGAKSPEDDE